MRKEFKGGALELTLSANITAGAASFSTSTATGWPTGSVAPFVALISQGSIEEKVLCSARSGNTFTVQLRGYDNTSAQSFTSGAIVRHVVDATTIDQANQFVNAHEAFIGHVQRVAVAPANTAAITVLPERVSVMQVSTLGGYPQDGMVLTVRPEDSSYNGYQLLFTDSASFNFYFRRSTSWAEWSPWNQLADKTQTDALAANISNLSGVVAGWSNDLTNINNSINSINAELTVMGRLAVTSNTTYNHSVHAGKMIAMSATAARTFTITNSAPPTGTVFSVMKYNTGAVTVAATSPVTFRVPGNASAVNSIDITDRYGIVTFWYDAAGVWIASGAIG